VELVGGKRMNCQICYWASICDRDIKQVEAGGSGSFCFSCGEYTPPSKHPADVPPTPEEGESTAHLYDDWKAAHSDLQQEEKSNGMSSLYWEIWHKRVCPAYRRLTEATPRGLCHPLTGSLLEDAERPVLQRRHPW